MARRRILIVEDEITLGDECTFHAEEAGLLPWRSSGYRGTRRSSGLPFARGRTADNRPLSSKPNTRSGHRPSYHARGRGPIAGHPRPAGASASGTERALRSSVFKSPRYRRRSHPISEGTLESLLNALSFAYRKMRKGTCSLRTHRTHARCKWGYSITLLARPRRLRHASYASSSSRALACFKSKVSKPSVNQP
jgi:hypothetical protein